MLINGIEVITSLPESEAARYVDRAPKGTTRMRIVPDGEYVDIYYYDRVPFERIRRITGYLVGTLDRFNDAKRAEVEDRVKHA